MRRLVEILLFVVISVVGLAGCNVHLPGLNDVEVEYEVAKPPDANAKKLPADLQVDLRLLRTRVPGTVSPIGSTGVRVVLDQRLAEPLDRALAWRGGLTIYRLTNTGEKKPPENVNVGDLLKSAPLFDAANATRVVADGKSLVVDLNEKDRAALAKLGSELGDEPVAFTRGPFILSIASISSRTTKSGLSIPRGDDILAYSRARRDARILAPPALNVTLNETNRRVLPRNLKLAVGCVLFPVIAGFLWIVFVRRFDRARVEPWWLMLATAVLGGLSGELAGFIEHHLRSLTPYLDPDVMTLDGSMKVFPITLLVYSITVGAVEEGTKLLATLVLANRRRELDEPIDGILYAAAAAIGFAVDENISYFAGYRLSGGLVTSRSIDCIAAHTLLSAIWGYALGMRLVEKRGAKLRVLRYFLLAALLHGATDTSITFHIPHSTLVFLVGLMTLFFLLLRNTLRWGTIDELRGEAPPSTTRALFRTGGGPPFGAAVATVYAAAAALTFGGRVMDADHGRLGVFLLMFMMGFFILLGAAAYAVTRTVPLDVAIDELGVTFAGSLRRWPSIEGTSRIGRDRMLLHSKEGDLLIGTAAEGTIAQIEDVIDTKKKARGEGGSSILSN